MGKGRRSFVSICVVIVFTLTGIFYNKFKQGIPLENTEVKLLKCTDGDTAHFDFNGKDKTIRFLAIDTPETVKPNTPVQPYGKEASDYTCGMLKDADNIVLEFEEEKTDKYGRLLAWIFVDGELLQKQLVENGLAKVAYLYGNYRYTDVLKEAEKIAKRKKIGVWEK